MGVQLNIKSEEARELAKKLADATGESLTDAVTTALRERWQRVRKLTTEEFIEKWSAIGTENRRLHPDMPGSADIDALLYDPDTGLPR
jgi:antitoxin VapB